jgi:hypothetical protein
MAAGADQEQRLLQQRQEGQAVDRLVAIEHGQVHAAVHDELAQRGAVVLVQVEQDAGVSRTHGAQQRQRERGGRRAGRQPHRHLAREPLAGRFHVHARLLALAQDDLRMPVQHLAGLGGRDAALGAHEQLLAHLALERGQLLAQRRLGDEKDFGRLRQAADVHDLHEIFEASQVHALSPSKSRA